MTGDTDPAPSLARLLEASGLALVKVDQRGRCSLMTPLAAQWLAPLLPLGTTANLVEMLAPYLAPIGTFFRGDTPSTVACQGQPLAIPGKPGAERHLLLGAYRLDEDEWLVRLAEPAADQTRPDPAVDWLLATLAFLSQSQRARIGQGRSEAIRLHTLLQNAGDAAIAIGLDGRVTLWNRAAEDLFGFTAAEALGRPLTEVTLTPEHAHEDEELFSRALQGQGSAPFETTRRRRDGCEVDVEISAGPILDEQGRVVGVSKMLRDITERRQVARKLEAFNRELAQQVAERTEQLRRTSADLRTVLDALPSMVGSWDRHLVNRFANRAYASRFGQTPEQVRGRHCRDLMGQAMYEQNLPFIEGALRGEAQTFERETRAPDGSGTRYSLVHYLPDLDAGQVQGFYVVVHDVGAVKRAQHALSESEALLQRVGGIAHVGGWWLELASGQLHWSAETRTIHDVPADYAPTVEQAIDFYAPEARAAIRQAVDAARAGGPGWDLELPFVTATGRRIWVRSIGEVEFAADAAQRRPVRLIGTFQDITARHEADLALHTAKQAAEAANTAKGEFLANMSHEIRRPLNAIIGLGYMLEQHRLPDAQKAMVAQIQTAGRSLMGVVNAVLDLSKIEAGHVELNEAPFDVRELLRAEVQMLGAGAAAKGLDLTLDVAADVPALVVGDAGKLTQLLTNLVGNAVKFTAAGSVSVALAPAGDALRHGLRLTVRDTGMGISAEAQARLFQPFTQADASITRQYGGTGLGLSIVARLARLMGGTVTLESALGQGSAFSVVVPLPPADDDDQAAARQRDAMLHVLVADDDPLQRQRLAELAASLGWRTQSVGSGRALVDRVLEAERQGQRFDALVVDWQMPDIDGLSALAELHRQLGDARTPAAVVVSAHDVARLRASPHAELAASILVKPVNGSNLFNAVNGAVASNEAAHERMLYSTLMGGGGSVWLSGMRLLLADDSALNLDVARHLLEHEGAIVTCCDDGQQVLARLHEAAHDYDAVLLDVQMPGMDGLEAARRIRHQLGLKELPLIALTAGVLYNQRDRALASGMSDFLGKPLEPRKFIRTLRRHVEHYRRAPVPVLLRATAIADEPDPELGIEGIDATRVAASLRADRPLYLSMLRRFLVEFGDLACPPRLPQDEQERARLAARMHKLRGSALVVGAAAVAHCGSHLEQALRSTTVAAPLAAPLRQLALGLTALQKHAAEALEELGRCEQARDAAAQARPPPTLGVAQLAELRNLLSKQSLGAIASFDRLAPALQLRLPAADFAFVQTAVRELDFATAADRLQACQVC